MSRRRRSVLLLSALTVSAGVAACEQQQAVQEQPMKVYASASECAAEQDWGVCETGFAKAKAEHDATAPKFATRAECEAALGPEACEERRTSTGSVFMPLMMGMMMGRMMSGSAAYPIYNDRNGAAYSGGTRVAGADPRYANGARAAGPRTVSAPVTAGGALAPASTTRGGFGQTTSYRGSAGG